MSILLISLSSSGVCDGATHSSVFSHLAQLSVEALNGVSRINKPPNLLRELDVLRFAQFSLQDFESCEVICAGDEDILDLPVFQIIQNGSPEFCAFIFANPHSEYRFSALKIDDNCYVNSIFNYLTLASNMVMERVHEHDRIHTLQRPVVSFTGFGKDFVGYLADCCVRNIHAINVLNMRLNIRGRHSLGVHRDDFTFDYFQDDTTNLTRLALLWALIPSYSVGN